MLGLMAFVYHYTTALRPSKISRNAQGALAPNCCPVPLSSDGDYESVRSGTEKTTRPNWKFGDSSEHYERFSGGLTVPDLPFKMAASVSDLT